MDNELKQILWVEGNSLIHRDFQKEALSYGLQLVPFDCWDDAYKSLRNDFSRWAAIIMQPKSKLHVGSLKKVMQFLPQAFSDINVISAIKGKSLPWYILTDIDEKEFVDLVLECRLVWDRGWPNKYYDSSVREERLMLFKRIKAQTQVNEKLMVRTGQYKNVFDALDYLYGYQLSSKVGEIMEDLLVSTCFGKAGISNFGCVRNVLEYLFHSMVKNGLLPKNLKNTSNKMNVAGCSKLLSGFNVDTDYYHFKVIDSIINEIMSRNIYNILRLVNAGSHADIGNDSIVLDNYLNSVGTNNLINSCALQLCDVILWYEQIIKNTQKQKDEHRKVFQWWSETKV